MHAIHWVYTRPGFLLSVVLPAGAVVMITALAVVLRSLNHTPPRPVNSAGAATHHFPLEISPDPIDLGILRRGESAHASVLIRNKQNVSLIIERVVLSCPCILAPSFPLQMGPHDVSRLSFSFDPSSEPDFEGKLAIEVTGYLAGGEIAFRTEVILEVQDGLDDQV